MSEEINEKYKDLSREDLLKIVEKMESRKKYGLIWDEEKVKEQFEKDAVNALPILKEIKGKEIATSPDEPINILIEGDNYHALSVLNFTHQGKIDVIYIDPPYNTGNKDFKYNDNYVDKEDTYRHSKWLSFMSKRLRLAKNLLAEGGVIFISIDDNEQAQLRLMCDEIFGEENFIEQIIWKRRATPPNDRVIGKNHEYVACYSKTQNYKLNLLPRTEETLKRYSNSDNDPNGAWAAADLSANGKGGRLVQSCVFSIKNPNNGKDYFPPKDKCWLYNKEKIDRFIQEGKVSFRKSGAPFLKRYLKEVRQGQTTPTIWLDAGFSQDSAKELKDLFNDENVFENPKPTTLIERLIHIGSNKNSIILDFMAGSGTTAQAVLEINKKDGGNRQFILCTNNELNGFEKKLREKGMSDKEIHEHGICRRVTYPRIEKVIKGYKNLKGERVKGLGSNLKYFKTGFVKKTINKDDMKIKLTRECTEMLCIREGVFDEKKKTNDYAIFEKNNRIMTVYYSIERKGLKDLKKELDKMKGEKVLYCFTLDPLGLDKSDFASWKDTQLEPIPQKILEIYEEIYEY
jgi:adenine-specific DNA-methyltransferase